MLQSVATIVSLFLAFGALALIAVILAEDWYSVVGALRLARPIEIAPLPLPRATIGDRSARVIRVSRQSSPQRAAA